MTEEPLFGVCRLSLVAVRSEPDHASAQTTQLLFGDHYEVVETSPDRRWLRIRVHFDQFEGWLDARQHQGITREHYEYINRADFKITTDLTSSILYNKSPVQVLMGSIIPISGSELFKMEEQFAFNGESKSVGQKRDVEFLKNTALKYINAPFLHGGKSPFGIDPAGFVQMVFKISGYLFERTLERQVLNGRPVKSTETVLPGDIAFFTEKGRLVHAGILLAEDKIIHVAGKVRIDHFNEEGILNLDTRVYTHTFSEARRVLVHE